MSKLVVIFLAAIISIAMAQEDAKRKELADIIQKSWDNSCALLKLFREADPDRAKDLTESAIERSSKFFDADIYENWKKLNRAALADAYKAACEFDIQKKKAAFELMLASERELIGDFELNTEWIISSVLEEFNPALAKKYSEGTTPNLNMLLASRDIKKKYLLECVREMEEKSLVVSLDYLLDFSRNLYAGEYYGDARKHFAAVASVLIQDLTGGDESERIALLADTVSELRLTDANEIAKRRQEKASRLQNLKSLAEIVRKSYENSCEMVKLLGGVDAAGVKDPSVSDLEASTKKFDPDVFQYWSRANPDLAKAYKTACELEIQKQRAVLEILLKTRTRNVGNFEDETLALVRDSLRAHDISLFDKIVKGQYGNLTANELAAAAALKQLCNAEAMFRYRGGLGAYYYVADVAGLHWGKLPSATETAGYIADEGIAKADESPKADGTTFDWDGDGIDDWKIEGPVPSSPTPYHGYLFGLLTTDETGVAYQVVAGGASPGKFGFYARPAEYGKTGIHTFLINEGGRIVFKDLGRSVRVTAYAEGNGWEHFEGKSDRWSATVRPKSLNFIISTKELKEKRLSKYVKRMMDLDERAEKDKSLLKNSAFKCQYDDTASEARPYIDFLTNGERSKINELMEYIATKYLSDGAKKLDEAKKAGKRARIAGMEEKCANNLRQLAVFLEVYRREKSAPTYSLPTDYPGSKLWKFLGDTFEESDLPKDTLVCPVSGSFYRGPKGTDGKVIWNMIPQNEAIGMCEECGNILFKSYSVKRFDKNSSEYKQALEKTE